STSYTVKLNPPYGGELIDLVVTGDERLELIERANHLPSIQISTRTLCDLELLATGAFSPLDRFMGQADYERVLHEMRLSNGLIFPIPVALRVDESSLSGVGDEVALRDARNHLIAVMQIEETFKWNPEEE